MRQITDRICRAFEQGRVLKIDNSETDGQNLWLFGNKIAQFRNGEIWITDAGWSSKTTRERLNGLSGVQISQRAGSWYLNGNLWQGEWTSVNENNGIGPSRVVEQTLELQVEFDVTSEWIKSKGYSRPIYSVAHRHTKEDLFEVEVHLNAYQIAYRFLENDTAGEYKPNHFLIVMPSDYELALKILNNEQ